MSVKTKVICGITTLFLLIGLVAIGPAQASMAIQNNDKKEKKDKKETDDPNAGRPVLWTERDMESLDLSVGGQGSEAVPGPSDKYTFVARDPGGTSEKIIVKDDKGRSWTVKFGPEARPETAASRIVWAAGYYVDPVFFVDRTHVEGRGGFDIWDVRFERDDDGLKTLGPWSWDANHFKGTREYQGLQTVMALINNWDLKDENNKIARPNKESGGDQSLRVYYVSDLGGTLGSTGNGLRKIPGFSNLPAGSKGKPDAFANQVFIDGVENGMVKFHYEGKNPEALQGVSVENARWMGNLLGRLSDKQLSDAFRSSGFTDAETAVYVRAMRDRINKLKSL